MISRSRARQALPAAPASPTTTTVAKSAIAITALSPWLWNFYIAARGWGPEMTAEIAAAVAVIITSLLTRIIDDNGG